jgi:GntP family gluconate:H+ symporter/Gnt-I system low-affinity gluconate transporter
MDFIANPAQLIAGTIIGFAVLLVLIIKLRIHALLAVLISAVVIGMISGMPLSLITRSVEDGMGNTLRSIGLIVGLGSMFGGILELSGGAKVIADKLVSTIGEKKSAFAVGIAGIIIGIPVFYDPAFIILMPIIYSIASKTGLSLVYYVLPMVAGLGIGTAIPPTPAPMLIAGNLSVDLGSVTLIAIIMAIPKYLISYFVSIPFGKKFFVSAPKSVAAEVRADTHDTLDTHKENEKSGPSFGLVLFIVLLPIILILLNASAAMIKTEDTSIQKLLDFCVFVGQPYLALIIANLVGIAFLCVRKGITIESVEQILNKALAPVAMIILVTAGGGVLRYVFQYSGMGKLIGDALQSANLSVILIAYIISSLMRICVGSTTVALTMTLGIVASFPQMAEYSPLYIACIGMAALYGGTSFSHVNDSGFWLIKEYMGVDLKTAFKTWTLFCGITSILGFIVLWIVSLFFK